MPELVKLSFHWHINLLLLLLQNCTIQNFYFLKWTLRKCHSQHHAIFSPQVIVKKEKWILLTSSQIKNLLKSHALTASLHLLIYNAFQEREHHKKISFKMAVIFFCSNSLRPLLSSIKIHFFICSYWSEADLRKDSGFYHLTFLFPLW